TLIESVGGWGKDLGAAVTSALNQFVDGTFHVLLAAFFGRLVPQQAEQAEKTIGGRARGVTTGNGVPWGPLPEAAPGQPDMRWFFEFTSRLKAKELPAGTHWIRLYYCQAEGQPLECEVLLDNDPWEELQAETAAIDWPKTEAHYSVRWFLVVQDP